MKVEVNKLNSLKRIIKVEVGEDALKKQKQEIYKDIGKSLKVPGFRQGTAPADVIEKHHPKVVKEEFLKRVLPVFYQKAVEEQGVIPASTPKISGVTLGDKELSFSIELEVKPEIKLEDSMYKGLKIKDKKVEVSESEWKKFWQDIKEEVKKRIKMEPSDEEVARWSGYPDVDALKDAAVTEIKNIKLRQRRNNIENQVVSALLKQIKVECPSTAVQEHQERLLVQEVEGLRARGISAEDIEKYKKDIEDKLKSRARDQVALFYILETIARRENLEVESGNLYNIIIGYILRFSEFSG